jgi:hypothetical protein
MSDRKSARIDSAIIAALIGVCGTITVTIITLFANRIQVTPTPTSAAYASPTAPVTETVTSSPVPTDTVPPGEPTSTPAPATETPTPSITPVPPMRLGEDWSAGCISTLWKPYPLNVPTIPRGDGCWQEPVHIFSAENGDLDFITERGGGGTEIYGLFAPLPESGSVTFRVILGQLSNVDLLMGVYAEPDVLNAPGLLMVIPDEKSNRLSIQQKDDVLSYNTLQGTDRMDQEEGFSITFNFTPNSATGVVNPDVFVSSPISIISPQKWLFLGYKGLPGAYRLDGRFFDLTLR